MLAHGHGDGLVTGATRKSTHVMDLINYVFDAKAEDGAVGVTALLHKGRIVLVADTLVHEWPDDEDLADIAERAAGGRAQLGLEPRVAFASFSNFGYPISERAREDAPRARYPRRARRGFRIRRRNDRRRGAEPRGDGALSVLPAVGSRPTSWSCRRGTRRRSRSR